MSWLRTTCFAVSCLPRCSVRFFVVNVGTPLYADYGHDLLKTCAETPLEATNLVTRNFETNTVGVGEDGWWTQSKLLCTVPGLFASLSCWRCSVFAKICNSWYLADFGHSLVTKSSCLPLEWDHHVSVCPLVLNVNFHLRLISWDLVSNGWRNEFLFYGNMRWNLMQTIENDYSFRTATIHGGRVYSWFISVFLNKLMLLC